MPAQVDALLLARAGLRRLGLDDAGGRCQCELGAEQMLPACAQGIVGAVYRRERDELSSLLRAADDDTARRSAAAELAFLDVVDAAAAPWGVGRPPLAAHLERAAYGGTWELRCLMARPDGTQVLRVTRRELPSEMSEADARVLGADAGEELLRKAGGGEAFFGARVGVHH